MAPTKSSPSANPVASATASQHAPPNLRRSLMAAGALLIALALAVKFRCHERFLSPSIHALRAAGGDVTVDERRREWVRALLGEDFGAQINSAWLTNPKLTDRQVARLIRPFANVNWITLTGMELGSDSSSALAEFNGLAGISLSNVRITRKLLDSLSGNFRLKMVDLSSCVIDGDALAGLSPLPVVNLDLRQSKVTDSQLTAVATLPSIVIISLRGCHEVSDAALQHFAGLTRVNYLGLQETSVTGAGLRFLAGSTALRTLNLRETPLGDDHLVYVPSFPSLYHLDVAKTPIGDAGVAHLRGMNSLNWLDLSSTKVTDDVLPALATLTSLTSLDLSNTVVTDRALATLAALPGLEWINLSNTRITDAGIRALSGFPKLSALHIRGNNISRETIAELRASRGNRLIVD